MRPYLALINIDLKLALRNKSVLFFNYMFPLIFFFTFAQFLGDGLGGRISYIVSMVLVLGILGNGLFGAGMRAVQEREANIPRRFKVAPISPIPILVASMVTGWVLYIPSVLLVLGLAHFLYGMEIPERWLALFALISIGVVAFRAVGLILAVVANSVQESNILIQTLYMPMLFLSGATFPMTMLPVWAQVTAQYLPATYLVTGFQGVFYRQESLFENWPAILALTATIFLATFVSAQLFRWEKEEKIAGSAKLWVLGVLLPFFVLGSYEVWSRDNIRKAEGLWRDLERRELLLIQNARVFVGDGRVIESGTVVVEDGKIQGVFDSNPPDSSRWQGEVIDAAGKTLLPGLIDVHVHLPHREGLTHRGSSTTSNARWSGHSPPTSIVASPPSRAPVTRFRPHFGFESASDPENSKGRSSWCAVLCLRPREATAPSISRRSRKQSENWPPSSGFARLRPARKPASKFVRSKQRV